MVLVLVGAADGVVEGVEQIIVGAFGGQQQLLDEGRIAVPDGFVFVLGHSEMGWIYALASGDYAEVSQTVDLTEVDLVRPQLRLRVPESTPVGWRWLVTVRVGGAPFAQATCDAGRERVLSDLAANVSKLDGLHEVVIRLQLEEV